MSVRLIRSRRGSAFARGLAIAALLAAGFAMRLVNPTLGLGLVLVIPTLFAAFWFGVRGGLAVGAVATAVYAVARAIEPEGLGAPLLVSSAVHLVIYCGVGYLFARLVGQRTRLHADLAERERELEELRALQRTLVPAEVPDRPDLELATCYVPAESGLGGDFFLVAEGPRDATIVAIGDVVGKGLHAARRAAYVRTALATFAPFEGDPIRLLEMANRSLIEGAGRSEVFVTAACVAFRPAEHSIAWALAGHPPPVLLDVGGALDAVRPGIPLGIEDRIEAGCGHAPLDPGTGLLLFTDGLVEARARARAEAPAANGAGREDQFGFERLAASVASLRGSDPATVVRALRSAVEAHAGGALVDDLCMVALRARR